MQLHDGLQTAHKGVERVVGIRLFGPQTVADGLLGEAVAVGLEEEFHQLALHGRQMDRLGTLAEEKVAVSVVAQCTHGGQLDGRCKGALPTELTHGKGTPKEHRHPQKGWQPLIGNGKNDKRRAGSITAIGCFPAVDAPRVRVGAQSGVSHVVADKGHAAECADVEMAAVVADGVGGEPEVLLGSERKLQGLVHVLDDALLGPAVAAKAADHGRCKDEAENDDGVSGFHRCSGCEGFDNKGKRRGPKRRLWGEKEARMLLLEVLIVLAVAPRSAPREAVLDEQTVEEIALLYLIGELTGAVGVGLRVGWHHLSGPVLARPDVGIVARIDVDGQSLGVLGKLGRAGNGPEIEAAGVVVAHGELVVGTVVVDETDALDGIARVV